MSSAFLLRLCAFGIIVTATSNIILMLWQQHRHKDQYSQSSLSEPLVTKTANAGSTLGRRARTEATQKMPSLSIEMPQQQTQRQQQQYVQSPRLEKMLDQDLQNPNMYFSACLLIRDDNALLNEWIAYHYHTLKLRYLVIATDPNSATSPSSILQRWENLTDLSVTQWSDHDFMPDTFLKKGYLIPLDRINGNATQSKWHRGHEDEEQVKRDLQNINSHRYRQLTFLSSCYRYLYKKKKTWVLHIDTDEYLTVNPVLRARGMLGQLAVPKDLREPMALFRFLLAIRHRPRLKHQSNYPCISLPRLMFGSVSTDTLGLVKDTYQAAKFETLRWKYHTSFTDRERNALPKVIVDVSMVDETDEMFKRKAFSIHRPSKKLCRFVDQIDFAKVESFPLTVNHYLGSWEHYIGRNDTRRSKFFYDAKAAVQEGRDDWVSSWIDGFLDEMEPQIARELLQDYL